MENNHHSNRIFSRFSCRFNSVTDVVESSIVTSNAKNLNAEKNPSKKPTATPTPKTKHFFTTKRSVSSNSGLFSTEDEEDGLVSALSKNVKTENDELDDCFSLSSDSSLSPYRKIGIFHRGMGFSSSRRGENYVYEIGSSSEASSSSSINSFDSVKKKNSQSRVTLADQFSHQSREAEDLRTKSSVFCRKTEEKWQKAEETKHLRSKSFDFCCKTGNKLRETYRKIGETEHLFSNSSAFCRKTGKFCRNIEEIGLKTEDLFSKSSVSCRKNGKTEKIVPKTGETEHIGSKFSKTSEMDKKMEIQQCPLYIGGNIEESYAIEKESRDPYWDFMESMVEMIIEKKISKSTDLDKLLLLFLSLNSSAYHKVILEVFSEVSEALISS